MEITNKQKNQLLSEGKTKQVYSFVKNGIESKLDQFVFITNKDDISAGDRSRNHRLMEGKGRITVETSSAIFEFLNAVGFETAFVSKVNDSKNSFVAKRCQMIPIEIVIRRIAFGTYLQLNPTVEEGFKFISPVIEIHIKDDANHDPLWSLDKLIAQKFLINELLIDENCINKIFKISKLVFEILERVWHSIDYQLVDLKVEFGVISDKNKNKSLVLADIIDNETWRLWPKGDKSLMVDKQIYRKFKEGEVDHKIIDFVRNEFQKVSNLTQKVFSLQKPDLKYLKKSFVLILIDNQNNVNLAQKLTEDLHSTYNLTEVEINKFNEKESQQSIDVINQSYCQVIITFGFKSSIINSQTAIPVIEYLNIENDLKLIHDISLSVAKILAVNNVFIWSKLRLKQFLETKQ